MSDLTRFARQMILPEVGPEGQARLGAAHVLVVGAGGLGCPVLQYLAGAGVGRITVIDPDHVEEGNLHRQPLYRMADIGQPKAEAATQHLRAAHPGVKITPIAGALHPAITADLVQGVDVVVDAADSFAVSYMLSDACLVAGRPLISASVLGQAGYVGGFCAGVPSLRAVFPELPARGATCASAGVLGPVVGMVGTLQAQLVLKVLLGVPDDGMGQLITLDLARLRFGGFAFTGASEPKHAWPFLSRKDLCDSDLVVELREEDEAAAPLYPDAVRVSPDRVPSLLCPADQRLVLCCATGLRAWQAAQMCQERLGDGHQLALIAARACG